MRYDVYGIAKKQTANRKKNNFPFVIYDEQWTHITLELYIYNTELRNIVYLNFMY